jgi:hypothetical protein
MIAKKLEAFLVRVGKVPDGEASYRMQKHREWRQLPTSRGRNAEQLSSGQIAMPILGMATHKLGYAGQVAGTLARLKPVGGVRRSFANGETLRDSFEALLTHRSLVDEVDEVRIYAAENKSLAEFHYSDVGKDPAAYVHETYRTETQKGGEKNFDLRKRRPPIDTPLVLNRTFFEDLHREIDREQKMLKHKEHIQEAASRMLQKG